MKFEEIPGHYDIKNTLRSMVSNRRIPHALLFSGEEGCGHLPTAVAFIQYIFCENKSAEDSCGKCRQCSRISKLEHPDLHLVFPIALSSDLRSSDGVVSDFRKIFLTQPFIKLEDWFNELGAENKQPVIPADESDQIIRKLSYTSYEGGYKVMLVWMPEKMNSTSANKLLKILEEPPDDTLFFLVTSSLDQLLTTIISRTQLVRFSPLSDEEISRGLVGKMGVSEEKAKMVSSLCGGNYRDALSVLSGEEGEVNYLELFQQFMRNALRFDVFKASEWVDNISSVGRENQKHFILYSLSILRECLMNNYGDQSLVKLAGAELEFIKKFSPFVNNGNYERMVEILNTAYYHIERNAHGKILFMDLALKMEELINVKNPNSR
jgi:DNA polymerase III subunit delta'